MIVFKIIKKRYQLSLVEQLQISYTTKSWDRKMSQISYSIIIHNQKGCNYSSHRSLSECVNCNQQLKLRT